MQKSKANKNNSGQMTERRPDQPKGDYTTIDDFVILDKLGDGAYSKVYKVERRVDKQIYALKKVKIGQMAQKDRDNAVNEVRILSSISHPNVI
jgi:NIMA (never in mitosis gene a)-related kinase